MRHRLQGLPPVCGSLNREKVLGRCQGQYQKTLAGSGAFRQAGQLLSMNQKIFSGIGRKLCSVVVDDDGDDDVVFSGQRIIDVEMPTL